jgi:hypothetical protein
MKQLFGRCDQVAELHEEIIGGGEEYRGCVDERWLGASKAKPNSSGRRMLMLPLPEMNVPMKLER